MASASKEANRYKAVENMLRLLMRNPARRFTRRKLFGTKHQAWQARALKELCDTDVIKRSGPHNNPTYHVKGQANIDALVEDEIEISGLAWPNMRTTQEKTTQPEPVLESPPPVEPDGSDDDQDDGSELADPHKIAQITIKLLGAVMENLIYLREKIESLDSNVGEVKGLRVDIHEMRTEIKEWKSLWE